VRPHDLYGRRHRVGQRRVGKLDDWPALDRRSEFPPSHGENPAAPPDVLFLGGERHRRVGLGLRHVDDLARLRIERKLVTVAGVGHRLGTLHDVQAEVERVPAKDVAHVLAADDDRSRPTSSATPLRPADSSRDDQSQTGRRR
jgi:hypothetical protein